MQIEFNNHISRLNKSQKSSLPSRVFHFTAFGIDWINQRWLVGNPPTYQEFAEMWQQEYSFRKQNKVAPKVEWAFINFTKEYLAKKPQATQTELHQAWQKERVLQKRIVESELKKIGIDICFDQK